MNQPNWLRSDAATFSDTDDAQLRRLATHVRRDVLTMTTRAGSGHIGGALSSTDIYVALWASLNITPANIDNPHRDRIVISHGHTAAGLYATLAQFGFIDRNELLRSFRSAGSIFEGHPNADIPGVEWCSGHLGQGLSVGCGFALSAQRQHRDSRTVVVMGDGEQQKGQLAEAREFAAKYNLHQLTAIIDANALQASGPVDDVMPQRLADKYHAAGWRVEFIDGHNFPAIIAALRDASRHTSSPTVIIARTIMGQGVSFIENKFQYHGQILTADELRRAESELTIDDADTTSSAPTTTSLLTLSSPAPAPIETRITLPPKHFYDAGKRISCRQAIGEALYDIVADNAPNADRPIAVIDCDLAESVRTQKIREHFPDVFIECGIAEHNAATLAGALSRDNVLTFFAAFGVFGLDECYSQHRMIDANRTGAKFICTHTGLDVGEDGKTHQCIDIVSLTANLFSHSLMIPADANHAIHMLHAMATTPGNCVLATGRSAIDILTDATGTPIFGKNYSFAYGRADWLQHGTQATIITCGTPTARVYRAANMLLHKQHHIGVLHIGCPLAIDRDALIQAAQAGAILVCEDHHIRTGLGSIVARELMTLGLSCRFAQLGITHSGHSASADALYRQHYLDEHSIIEATLSLIKDK